MRGALGRRGLRLGDGNFLGFGLRASWSDFGFSGGG